jgi:hypothetical protein
MSHLAITIQCDVREWSAGWREAVARALDAAKDAALRQAMLAGLDAAAEATPVATGRARSAWWAARDALAGNGGDLAEARVTVQVDPQRLELIAENRVPYIALIEEGAQGHPPQALVAPALQGASAAFAAHWRLDSGATP